MYIDNSKLYEAFVQWYEQREEAQKLGQPEPEPPRYITEAIILIPTKLASKGNFSGYSFKEEMIGDAIENIIRYYKNFNPKKSKNPFAYLTQIAYNAFLRRIHNEKYQAYIKHKLLKTSDIFDICSTQEHDKDEEFNIANFEVIKRNVKPELEDYFEKRKRKRKSKKIMKINKNSSLETFLT